MKRKRRLANKETWELWTVNGYLTPVRVYDTPDPWAKWEYIGASVCLGIILAALMFWPG